MEKNQKMIVCNEEQKNCLILKMKSISNTEIVNRIKIKESIEKNI